MGSSESKVAPAKEHWSEELNREICKVTGVPGSGGFFTGIDLVTLPMAYFAGTVLGCGLTLWHSRRPVLAHGHGFGVFLCGLTLAAPPYVRSFYAPFLFISPVGLSWAGITGGVMGYGLKVLGGEEPVQPGAAEDPDSIHAPELYCLRGFCAGALIAMGLYLALPGAARVFMVYR